MKKQRVTVGLVLVLILALGAVVLPAYAQTLPDNVREKGIAAVQQALNRTDRPTNWEFVIEYNIHNTNLDCPLVTGTNVDQSILVYALTLYYDGYGYGVRVSSDASLVQLCDPAFITGAPSDSGATNPVPVPAASWWAVLVDDATRSLHWVNPGGLFTTTPWPVLPNQNMTWTPAMMLSRDGHYLVMVANRTDGLMSVGFYDLQVGAFTQVHTAQQGETISRVQRYAFDAASQRVAVGFQSQTGWRVIIFDLASGAALAQLTNTHPDVAAALNDPTLVPPLVSPVPVFFANHGGQDVVYLQMLIPVDAPTQLPAIQWRVPPVTQLPEVAASTLTYPFPDMLPATVQSAITYHDPNVPLATPPGGGPVLMHNAVGSAGLFDLQPLYSDGARLLYGPHWGANGQMVGFWGIDSTGSANGYWIVPGSPTLNQFVTSPQTMMNINEGLLWQDQNGNVYLQRPTNIQPQVIYTVPRSGLWMLWALSPDSPFALTNLLASGGSAGSTTSGYSCAGAPPTRLVVGSLARVANTGTPLRLRDVPGGAWLQDLPVGTVVTVIGGPQCSANYSWWNLRLPDGSTGWSAEGDLTEYFLELAS
ncbi:MAG: hypothetical protein JXQ72_16975 [Anaerolineae bacterium]|nr:hypothetical protein [Anaerolineae bacterium]